MSLYEFDPKEIPAIRIAKAIGAKADKNLLFVVGGGLGDRFCAEPVIRYAMDTFKDCEISLCCSTPELFRHLKFKATFLNSTEVPDNEFLPLYTYQNGLSNQFFNPNLMHGVDFSSVSSIRGQLPWAYRSPRLNPETLNDPDMLNYRKPAFVIIHVGKSWPSRTLPASWYHRLIDVMLKHDRRPVLVGKDCVDIKIGPKTVDLRDKLTLNEFMWLCKQCDAIVTNDSSPVHFASAGIAKIAMIATCRRPEFIMHHRVSDSTSWAITHPQFGWRTRDFSVGNMWDLFKYEPNDLGANNIAEIPDGRSMEEFLPDPELIATWIERTP